jgi:hypothetical protein
MPATLKPLFFLSHNYAVTISAEQGAPHLEEIRQSGREHPERNRRWSEEPALSLSRGPAVSSLRSRREAPLNQCQRSESPVRAQTVARRAFAGPRRIRPVPVDRVSKKHLTDRRQFAQNWMRRQTSAWAASVKDLLSQLDCRCVRLLLPPNNVYADDDEPQSQ